MVTFFKKYIAQFDIESISMEVFSKIVSLLLLFLVFYLIKAFVHRFVRRLFLPSIRASIQDNGRQRTISRLLGSFLNYVLYFLLLYSVLTILGLPVSSLLAGAGIAGVAIGMGAQGFLSDLVNGFFILLERQFDVGDMVSLTNGSIKIKGTVANVGIRTTQVRDLDGTLHFIPNRNILVVSNQSRGDMRVQVDIPLSITADLGKVERIIERVHEKELKEITGGVKEVTVIGPHTLDSGQFVFRVQFFVVSGQQGYIHQRFYTLYQEALLAEQIELVQPQS